MSLEDLVYRATLAEGERAIRAGNPWLTIPITLAIAGLMGFLTVVLGPRTEPPRPRTVGIVLQEGPEAPAHAPAGAAPAPRAQPPAPAPAPAVQPKETPPPPALPQAVPEQLPRALPKEDNSRLYGSNAAPGGVPGGTGKGGDEGPAGTGTGPAGQRPARILDLDISQVKEKYRPDLPAYPAMARMARIQGTVVVQILVGVDGIPISAVAQEGPYPLRATAEAYALAWKFEPYLQNGVAMASRFSLSVTFKLLH